MNYSEIISLRYPKKFNIIWEFRENTVEPMECNIISKSYAGSEL